jgi:hypothetical protein
MTIDDELMEALRHELAPIRDELAAVRHAIETQRTEIGQIQASLNRLPAKMSMTDLSAHIVVYVLGSIASMWVLDAVSGLHTPLGFSVLIGVIAGAVACLYQAGKVDE